MSAGDQHDPTTTPDETSAVAGEHEAAQEPAPEASTPEVAESDAPTADPVDAEAAAEEANDAEAVDDAAGETAEDETAEDETAEDGAAENEATDSSDAETETDEAEEPAKAVRLNSAKDFEARDAEEEEKSDSPAMNWYILKVQSNRENSICDGLRRRVAVEGLDDYFGEILVPTEDVAEFKNGKRRVVKRKLYPGYIVAHMVINDDTWFAVRETPGIGDFTGAAGKPTPMLPHEVERIIKAARPDEESDEPKPAIPFKVGDRVRIKEGTFENFEGDVDVIDSANGRVTVMISIFGRSTPVELEHWQIEDV